MANTHYGQIGDVWKHLPLAEILSIESPSAYWESNAGSAQYPLTHSAERDYGVFFFASHARQSPALADSRYREILGHCEQRGRLTVYPGSPLIAMMLLGGSGSSFLFCDIDGESLSTIRESANERGLIKNAVRTVERDGVAALLESLAAVSAAEASTTFVHIDPYDPFARSSDGFTSLDLFCRVSARGMKAMLWYGFDSLEQRERLLEQMRQAMETNGMDPEAHRLWIGEIVLDAINDAEYDFNPGVLGCGVLCSSLSPESLSACRRLGEELESVYSTAKLPEGCSGTIEFMQSLCRRPKMAR
jgi:23S rRNA (adenine2030-N6)-methyltransferase